MISMRKTIREFGKGKLQRLGRGTEGGDREVHTVEACLAAGRAIVRIRNWTRRNRIREMSGRCIVIGCSSINLCAAKWGFL